MRRYRLTRALVVFAAVILAFDGVGVVVVGLLAHRPLFVAVGVITALAAVATLFSWNRYRKHLQDIARERDHLKDELRTLDDFIQRR